MGRQGVTILSDGKSARKSLAFRVMRPAVPPREALSSIRRWCAAFGRLMRSRALLLRLWAGESAQSLLCRCRDSALGSRADLFRASSACIRGFEPVLKPVRVRSFLSLKFSCHVEYIMSIIMSTGGFRGIIGIAKSESCNFWNWMFFEKIEL